MKKLGFKVLCMVLVMALLSPNVFAATPAPEVPLADEATVTRVKNEIATGEITDMEDLFLVAYQHLGADISKDGMTAYINEDGTLGITQIIENTDGDASVYSIDSNSGEINFAVSTLALIDDEGNLLTDYESYYIPPDSDYGGAGSAAVSTAHTAYYYGRRTFAGLYYEYEIKLNYMVTSFNSADINHYVTKVVQEYKYFAEYGGEFEGEADESDSKTTTCSDVAGSISFAPAASNWYPDDSGTARIETYAKVYITGINQPISLKTVNALATFTD